MAACAVCFRGRQRFRTFSRTFTLYNTASKAGTSFQTQYKPSISLNQSRSLWNYSRTVIKDFKEVCDGPRIARYSRKCLDIVRQKYEGLNQGCRSFILQGVCSDVLFDQPCYLYSSDEINDGRPAQVPKSKIKQTAWNQNRKSFGKRLSDDKTNERFFKQKQVVQENINRRKFEKITISHDGRDVEAFISGSPFSATKPSTVRKIMTDSSSGGWGCYDTTNDILVYGKWKKESEIDINSIIPTLLEIRTILLSLQCLCSNSPKQQQVVVYTDSLVSVVLIGKAWKLDGKNSSQMKVALSQIHGRQFLELMEKEIASAQVKYSFSRMKNKRCLKMMECHFQKAIDSAVTLVEWCREHDIVLSCQHVFGSANMTADLLSRQFPKSEVTWFVQ